MKETDLFRFHWLVRLGVRIAMLLLLVSSVHAAELPLVRIAHGAFSEKILIMWLGAEQGLFRKHGVNVEVINIRSGPQTMAALASGDIQIAYTIPGSVVSAATSGFDVAFFAGIVNKADGDFIASPQIHTPEELKGKRVGVQSIGGGVWSMAMLAFEHLGLEPNRDKMTVLIVGDSPVLAQSLESGGIEATYLNYVYSRSLKEKGFPVLLDLGKAPIPYQGLAAATRRSYISAESADHRCAHARLCRKRGFHSQTAEQGTRGEIADEKLAAKKSPGRRDRLSGTPMALQPRYQTDRSGNSEYGEASRARESEGQIRQNAKTLSTKLRGNGWRKARFTGSCWRGKK